jgi:outer membrane protein assembly factor BamB
LISLDGEDQLVLLTSEAIIGVAPQDGALLWQHRFDQEAEYVMTPVWLGDGRLLFSSTPARGSGASRMVRLARENGEVVVKEVWHSRRVLFIQANPIVVDEYVYGSSGYNPSFFVGVDARTGERLWAKREPDPAACLQADGKVLILDQEGWLSLATVNPDGLTIHSRCKVTDRLSFTAPTLVGNTLYVRDRKHIMALDLG